MGDALAHSLRAPRAEGRQLVAQRLAALAFGVQTVLDRAPAVFFLALAERVDFGVAVFAPLRERGAAALAERSEQRLYLRAHRLYAPFAFFLYLAKIVVEIVVRLVDELRDVIVVHVGHEVLREVQDAVEVSRGQVEQQPEPAGGSFGEPDVRHRRGEGDVSHALAPDLRARHLHAAAVAEDALEADLLVLAAVALPVFGRPEDALAEQPVLLRAQRAVVDGLRLRHFPIRPDPYLLGGSQRYSDCVEIVAAKGHAHAP